MASTLVLSVGLDAELLSARNFILHSAGYFVVPAYSLKEAVDRFRNGDFDLALLCRSIPAREKCRLTSWIRASGSRIPLVSVSGESYEDDHFADGTVGSDPDELLIVIREVLKNLVPPTVCALAPCHEEDASALQRIEPSAQGKQLRHSATGYERQTMGSEEYCGTLARAG